MYGLEKFPPTVDTTRLAEMIRQYRQHAGILMEVTAVDTAAVHVQVSHAPKGEAAPLNQRELAQRVQDLFAGETPYQVVVS